MKLVEYTLINYTQQIAYVNRIFLSLMALSHTILTVLLESAHSGYDLSKRFEESVSCFWKASQQQIYRELGKMEKSGWVEYETIPQLGKPDKKLYRITPTGQTEWMKWLEAPTVPTPIREDLLVKVLAGPHIPTPLLIRQIEERRSLHEAQLTKYLEKEALFQQIPSPEQSLRYRYLTLRRGIRYEQEWIDWCNEVLREVDNKAKSSREH